MMEIMSNSGRVEMINDPALTAGSSALHLLQRTTDKKCYDTFLVLVCRLETTGVNELRNHLFFSRQVKGYLMDIGTRVDECVYKDSLARGLIERHPWTAEWPARTIVEVHLYGVLLRHIFRIAQGLHPFGREIRQLILLIPLYAIDRCDLYGANAGLMQLVEVPFEVCIVYR